MFEEFLACGRKGRAAESVMCACVEEIRVRERGRVRCLVLELLLCVSLEWTRSRSASGPFTAFPE